ncbi:MAG TPA: hypothetical protein VHZ95_05415, partial [Polyangiales bacterium]|nr:hypothetical protein [Polyangiales bacterium]
CSATLDAPGSTFVVPPSFQQYLEAPQRQSHSHFGDRLALDGSALAITAPFEVASGEPMIPADADDFYTPDGEGAVYLFDLAQPTAAALRIIAPNAEPGDSKLASAALEVPSELAFTNLPAMNVAIDDDWLAVGIAGEDSALEPDADPSQAEANNDAENAGAVYVYARSKLATGDLTLAQYIKAPNIARHDYFGTSLVFVGNQLIIGASGEDGGQVDDPADDSATDSGAVYVYTLQDGRFVFDQYVKEPAPIQPNQLFGFSVSADDDLLAIGAPLDSSGSATGPREDVSSLGEGAAYLFRNRDGKWQFEAYLKPDEAFAGSGFGWSVRVSKGEVAIGAPRATNCRGESPGSDNGGRVYSFANSADWSIDECLGPKTRNDDFFGGSLGMLGDRLLIGAGWDASGRIDRPSDNSLSFAGAAYLEARTDGAWRQRAYVKAPKPAINDVFGSAVELDDDFVVIGASQRSFDETGDTSSVFSGAVYVFKANLEGAAR